MNTIDIRSCDQYQFIKYLGNHLNTQPALSDVKRFQAQIEYDSTSSNISSMTSCFLTPWIGSHHWHYKNEVFLITIQDEGSPVTIGCSIDYYHRIQVSHPDLELLSTFVKDALTYSKPIESQQIKIMYSKSKGYWEHFNNIYAQPLSKVYLDPATKDCITTYIDAFIASKQRYINFGRPYKLNFLLTGVPGAGKTSLVKAVALKYGRPVYVLSFTKGLTDETLVELMSDVKDNAIILLEDIDAFFVDRESKGDINVSFSALLNIMDGTIMKGNGTIMFLTANNPDRLDSALIRPGRIDHIVRFDFPRQQEIKEAFFDICGTKDDKLFVAFYSKIKGVRVNMSSLVDYLFRYSSSYMENIDELLKQVQLRQEISAVEKVDKMYI